jgi:hypothetical protein
MTAEGDGFALFVTTVGVTAIAAFQLDKGKMPRIGLDTAQLDQFRLLRRGHRPVKPGRCRHNRAHFALPV